MISNSDIIKVDQSRIIEIYERWPKYFLDAAKITCLPNREPEYYSNIILCGMGASGTSCDILQELLVCEGKIPSYVVKGGSLPAITNSRSLVIVNSVSGNTAETLENLNQAAQNNSEVVCISSGGELRNIASKNGYQHISIPNLSLPRASLPFLIMPGLNLLKPFLKTEVDALQLFSSLKRTYNSAALHVEESENIAKRIASFLENSFAFCFTSPSLISVGNRFKNSLNENAKVHCIRESVLEASHNEVVPFTYPNSSAKKVLMIKWTQDNYVVRERFSRLGSFFSSINQEFMELEIDERGLLDAIISAIYLLDYSTIYLAVARGTDPSPTPAIDILKMLKSSSPQNTKSRRETIR